MTSNQPPRIAAWLLRYFGSSANNDVVIGDLDERYRQGRSRVWYWRQVLVALAGQRWRTLVSNSILVDGEEVMLKVAVTFLLLGLLIVFSTLAFHGSASDLPSVAGTLASINGLIILVLLTLRAVWRSSSKALLILQWPTAIAAGMVGLNGITTVLYEIWSARRSGGMDPYSVGVGQFLVLMCILTAFSLWRTKPSTDRSSARS
jgi:hypothetical protein